MSTAAVRTPAIAKGRIHLPSVHVRTQADPATGFDYEEDIYVRGHGRERAARRMIALVLIESDEISVIRQTTDVLTPEELAEIDEQLPFLMDAENPELLALMEERGRAEYARQVRIANGDETRCASCGCSESRACSGGCVWATKALCSRCL